MGRLQTGAFGGEDGRVDVCREVVVVDKDADTGVVGCACCEHVEPEMERSVLGDVVIRRLVWNGQSNDSLSVACLDDCTETAPCVPEGTVRGEIEISMVCRGRVGDVWRR
jgi:hypothetical protein